MHRRDISQAKDTSSGNESAVPRKDEYRRRAEQMNKEKIKSDHRSSIQSKKTSEVDQESTSSSKDRISYRNGILELAKQSQLAYHQKGRSLTHSTNQRYRHLLQDSNTNKYKLLASHSTARELGVPKGCFDRPKTYDSSDETSSHQTTSLVTAWLDHADAKYNAANAPTPFGSCRSNVSTVYWSFSDT